MARLSTKRTRLSDSQLRNNIILSVYNSLRKHNHLIEMTENGELSNVKALLRGLLISSTKAMTIDALKRDFKQEEGRDIPFLQLGYSSLNAFLKSIPDTLKLVDDPYNRITTVIPVKNEKTAHIDALVMKQRVVIPKRRNGYCAPVVLRRREALSTPIVDRKPFDQSRVDRTFSFSTASRPFSNDQYYSHQHHSQQATPYSQSYVQPARFYNQSSPHSHKPPLLPHTPPLLPHIPPLLPHIPPLLSHLPSPQSGLLPSQSHRPYQSKLPSQSPLPSQSNLPSQSHQPSPSKSQSQQQSHSHTSITHKPNCESNGLDAEKNFKNSIPLCEEDYAPSHDLGSNLSRGKEEQYLNIVPAGGEDFDEIEETTNTLEETLQFDEESRHESASKGFWEINSSTPIKTNDMNKLKTPGIPSRIKFNLSHLVEKFPDGLHYLKLGEIYEYWHSIIVDLEKELYGHAVDYSEIGFDTLEDLLLTVSESIVQIHYINNEMFVYPGKKNSDYDDPPPILPKQGALDTLMEAMQTTTSKKLCMLPETVVEGHFCVAPYQLTDDVIEWTRAKINKIMSDTEVKVFFVDHGSTSLVNMKDLRYIHKDFADLPLQALLGKMSGIGPPRGQNNWPVEASKTFIKLLDSRPVVATVVEVNHKARSISALLVDTSSREDVVINQELVQLGLASVLPSLVNKVNQVEIEAKESARGDQQLEESQICEDTTTLKL
uniref:Tudor domain-containing protein 7 n=1 Tax=Timema cristinae TaxID=61476 RepID=A0A7R9GRT9_TIMCR|nr:unnamed protein product [Timema cristinae]